MARMSALTGASDLSTQAGTGRTRADVCPAATAYAVASSRWVAWTTGARTIRSGVAGSSAAAIIADARSGR